MRIVDLAIRALKRDVYGWARVENKDSYPTRLAHVAFGISIYGGDDPRTDPRQVNGFPLGWWDRMRLRGALREWMADYVGQKMLVADTRVCPMCGSVEEEED